MLRIIIGSALALFLPGFLLSFLLRDRMKLHERIGLGAFLNIAILVVAGFSLSIASWYTGKKLMAPANIWLVLSTTSIALLALLFIRWIARIRGSKKSTLET